MSKITIALPEYIQPKTFSTCSYKEWDSKGTYTYDPETGVYGYYRKLRFGSVVGYCDGNRASFCLRNSKGKEVSSLNVKPRHLGGKSMLYRKLRPFRGLKAAKNFLKAITKPMFYTDSKEHLVGEMYAVISLFINMTLPIWERNNFPSCNIETKEYDEFMPPYLTVLFPLLQSKDDCDLLANSKKETYKALRGEVSLSKLTKHFFGTESAMLNKLSQRILTEGKVHSYGYYLTFYSSKELLSKGFSPADLLRIPESLYQEYSLPRAIQHISLNKLLSLELSQKDTFNKDTLSLLACLPEGMKVGKGIRNMTHLHEVLSFVVNRLRDDNFSLWSHPQFERYNGSTILGLEVVFPKTSNILKEWGTALGICIGGYGSRIHSGTSICFALYKFGKPVVCVELNGYSFSILQVYGRKNQSQPQILWDAIKDSLNLENCTYTPMVDYDRPKEKVVGEISSPESLYKEALYRTTRMEEWAHIMCAHENRQYCAIENNPLGGDIILENDGQEIEHPF